MAVEKKGRTKSYNLQALAGQNDQSIQEKDIELLKQKIILLKKKKHLKLDTRFSDLQQQLFMSEGIICRDEKLKFFEREWNSSMNFYGTSVRYYLCFRSSPL